MTAYRDPDELRKLLDEHQDLKTRYDLLDEKYLALKHEARGYVARQQWWKRQRRSIIHWLIVILCFFRGAMAFLGLWRVLSVTWPWLATNDPVKALAVTGLMLFAVFDAGIASAVLRSDDESST